MWQTGVYRRAWLVLVFAVCACVTGPSSARSESAEAQVATNFITRLAATWQENSTAQDLDALLSAYKETVVYEHPRVGIRIEGKDQIRAAMARYIGLTRKGTFEVVSRIVGRGIVVLEIDLNAEARAGSAWEAVRRKQVIVIELDGDKISRVADYW